MISWKNVAAAVVIAAAAIFCGRGWEQWGAAAAPIACPPSQTATHTSDGGWFCVNPAGHDNASEHPKH